MKSAVEIDVDRVDSINSVEQVVNSSLDVDSVDSVNQVVNSSLDVDHLKSAVVVVVELKNLKVLLSKINYQLNVDVDHTSLFPGRRWPHCIFPWSILTVDVDHCTCPDGLHAALSSRPTKTTLL